MERNIYRVAAKQVGEANNVRLSEEAEQRLVTHATSMESEELAAYVRKSGWGDVLLKLVHLKPYIEVLWSRFSELTYGETIAGCCTKEEFCEQCLHRSIRAVQYMLYGRTPAKAKTALTPEQEEVCQALVAQGFKLVEAKMLAKAATGASFEERFKSALTGRFAPPVPEASAAATPDAVKLGAEPSPGHDDSQESISDDVTAEPPQPAATPIAPIPEPDCGSLEELRQCIARMADTNEIEGALRTYLSGLVQPLFQDHAYALSADMSIYIRRNDYHKRIVAGDWVEYRGGDSRLTKQTGQDATLGRVVAEDDLYRPKIRWYNGQNWTKPYTLFNNQENSSFDDDPSDDTVRVLFDHQAAAKFPEAFASYEATKEGKRFSRKPAAPAERSVEPQSETAERTVAPEIADDEPATQKPRAQTVLKKPVGTATTAKSVKSLTVEGVTVAVGFHCKFGGVECEVTAIFPGDDPSVSLIRSSDGQAIGPVPVGDLRFIAGPDAAAD